MRQVFLQKPWIYFEEPPEIKEIYYRYGKLERLKRGTILLNGGADGKYYYLKKGLAAFSFQDKTGCRRIFSLIIPKRALADIDGTSMELVNVIDSVIRDSEVLSISRDVWHKHIGANPELMHIFTKGIISKQETHMEAMIANYTLSADDRIRVFFKALITSYQPHIINGWNDVPLYLSNEEYSSLIGASRITISRIFAKLVDDGVLKKNKREISVHSNLLHGLYDWAENEAE